MSFKFAFEEFAPSRSFVVLSCMVLNLVFDIGTEMAFKNAMTTNVELFAFKHLRLLQVF